MFLKYICLPATTSLVGLILQKEDVEPLAGYLSLHQGFDGLCLKWTPNQLMNGCCEEEDEQTIDRRYLLPATNGLAINYIFKPFFLIFLFKILCR